MENIELAKQRAWVELTASLLIWTLPVAMAVVFLFLRWRLARYMRRRHPDRWRGMGGRGIFVNHSLFGSFLFDKEDDLADGRLRRMKRRVLTSLIAALASVILAFVLNVLSDLYVAEWIGP